MDDAAARTLPSPEYLIPLVKQELGAEVAPARPVEEAELPESAAIAQTYAAAHGG